jgi:signal transduction histidine kinase
MSARKDHLLDAAIAAAAFAVSLVLLAAGDAFGPLEVVLTALASLPLAARRALGIIPVFALTTLGSSALHLVAEPVGPPIGATVALFWMASGSDERRRPLNLGVAVGGFLVHLTASGLGRSAFPGTELLFGSLLWSGIWLAGERTRLRQERLAQLEERALRAEREAERERQLAAAEERTRIARDLHDSAGHAINVILVHAGLGRLRTHEDPEAARKAFETIEEVARETVGEIDNLVAVLRDDAATRGEVEPPPGLAALDGLVARHRAAGLDVTSEVRGDRRALAPGVDRGAYRILQEALTNAARHGAGGARVEVSFGPAALEITVANPVQADPVAGDAGHGLVGMRERAALLGGRLEAGASNGSFRVHARLPLADGGA